MFNIQPRRTEENFFLPDICYFLTNLIPQAQISLSCQFLTNLLFLCLKGIKNCLPRPLLWASYLWDSRTFEIKFVFLLLNCLKSIIKPAKEPRREERKSSPPLHSHMEEKDILFFSFFHVSPSLCFVIPAARYHFYKNHLLTVLPQILPLEKLQPGQWGRIHAGGRR